MRATKTAASNNKMIQWEAVTLAKPTREEIAAAQIAAGYDPGGYGGPFDISSLQMSDTQVRTTWKCFASAD